MTLNDRINEDLLKLLIEIENSGIKLCLVGGAVRDFLQSPIGNLGLDLDFEIRSKNLNSNWDLEYNRFVDFFESRKIKTEKLPYQIIRVYFLNYSLEFSTPRIEEHLNEETGHHHFNAQLSPKLTFEQSFSRRDFTLNAIGINCHFCTGEFKLVDPFNGQVDLKLQNLKPINEDFYNDHVRFLRTIRFFSLGYNIDKSINFKKFNLNNVSNFHLSREFSKSNRSLFLDKLVDVVSKIENTSLDYLKLINFKFNDLVINSTEDVFIHCLKNNLSDERLVKALNLNEKKINKIIKVNQALVILTGLDLDKCIELIKLDLTTFSTNQLVLSVKQIIEERDTYDLFHNLGYQLNFKINSIELIQVRKDELSVVENSLKSFIKIKKLIEYWVSHG